MIKKILTTLIFTSFILATSSMTTFAQTKTGKPTLNELFPSPTGDATTLSDPNAIPLPDDPNKDAKDKKLQDTVNALDTWEKSLKPITQLPQGTEESIIAGIIRVVLSIGGTLAALGLLVAGIMYLIAQDNEDQTAKAKKILIYSIIGIIAISISFAIFTGLATLVFTN